MKRHIVIASLLVLLSVSFAVRSADAGSRGSKPSEYELIVRHLKTKYRAKKVNIPFMWLARFAVNVVRPAFRYW